MISVIVYGRNDDRGYGMVKRVAISLNAIAHVLSAPESEILFVDYNTPDHLPTLPEAIADTLTVAAREKLRVFRVRPSVHARFAGLTPLPVLEPVARNVALRRSNPCNPWILSTNTDVIIALQGGKSLDQVVEGLEPASYGVPRFELPERAWEGFDRLDPAGCIAGARAWGRIGRLEEAVSSEGDLLFDGPGDFQLVPRGALFSIDGFNEDMLLGWHVDYNIAVRLAMRLGRCRDLSDQVALYHCGHVRQATQTHGHDRIQNDISRFAHRVRQAECPAQRNIWGCPDDPIEEIRLRSSRSARVLEVVGSIVPPLEGGPLKGRYDPGSFGDHWYDAGQVATHVLDLLSAYPVGARFGFAGARSDMFAYLKAGLSGLGFERPLLVPASMAERLGVSGDTGVQVISLESFAEQCDVPIFEFGLMRDTCGVVRDPLEKVSLTQDEFAALEAVREVFDLTATAELGRELQGRLPRLLVTVNAVHNRYEQLVASQLAAVAAPFSTRLRYGTLKALNPGRYRETQAQRLGQLAGLTAPPTALEIMQARGFLRALSSTAYDADEFDLEIAAAGDLIEALLEDGTDVQLGPNMVAQVRERLASLRCPRVDIPLRGGRGAEPPAFASVSAWSDASWRLQADRFARREGCGQRRDGRIWERAHLLWSVARRSRSGAGRALVVCEHPEALIGALHDLFDHVDVIDVRRFMSADAAELTRLADFATGSLPGRHNVRVVEDVAGKSAYDAVILPHAAGFRHGVAGFADVVAVLRPALADGGLFAVAGEVACGGRDRAGRPDLTLAGKDGLPAILKRFAALSPIAPVPSDISMSDAALVGTQADLDDGRPVLGLRRDGDVFWPVVWLFEARRGRLDAHGLNKGMRMVLLGELLSSMKLGPGGCFDAGFIVASGDREGHVFYGPYLSLPKGRFKASIELAGQVVRQGHEVKLVGEVALGDDIVVQRTIAAPRKDEFRVIFDLPFTVATPNAAGERLCEVRLWSNGAASVKVRSVRIDATR